MDTQLLAAKQIAPSRVDRGFVDGYELRIGERATLVAEPGRRVYGLVMDIARGDIARLYAEAGVADYLPQLMSIELENGTRVDASCYVLPVAKLTGSNSAYAQSLLSIAAGLEFPASYLDEIRKQALRTS